MKSELTEVVRWKGRALMALGGEKKRKPAEKWEEESTNV